MKKIIIYSLWIVVVVVVFFSSLKSQVIVPEKYQKIVSVIMPQGWGFFTKNPRDNLLDVYKVENDGVRKITTNNFSLETYFGISRKARNIGYESAQIINDVDKKYWQSDTWKNLRNLNRNLVYKSQNDSLKYLTKGKYIFITYKIVPYKWAKNHQVNNSPIEYVFVEIE